MHVLCQLLVWCSRACATLCGPVCTRRSQSRLFFHLYWRGARHQVCIFFLQLFWVTTIIFYITINHAICGGLRWLMMICLCLCHLGSNCVSAVPRQPSPFHFHLSSCSDSHDLCTLSLYLLWLWSLVGVVADTLISLLDAFQNLLLIFLILWWQLLLLNELLGNSPLFLMGCARTTFRRLLWLILELEKSLGDDNSIIVSCTASLVLDNACLSGWFMWLLSLLLCWFLHCFVLILMTLSWRTDEIFSIQVHALDWQSSLRWLLFSASKMQL